MPLPPDFWQKLPKRSDDELYEALDHSGDYLPEALDAVRAELARRELPEQRPPPAAPVETEAIPSTREQAAPRNDRYRIPILTSVYICCGVLTLVATLVLAMSDLGRVIPRAVIVVVGIGSAVIYFGIAQVIDYLGRTAHATQRLCDILERDVNT